MVFMERIGLQGLANGLATDFDGGIIRLAAEARQQLRETGW